MKLKLFSDGGARGNPGPAAAGAVLQNSVGETVGSFSQFLGDATNNQAEYFAALLGVQKAVELGATEIEILLDSKLVVEQVAGRWKIKDLELKKIAEKIHAVLGKFKNWEISHIPREKNQEADALVNQVLDSRGFKKTLFRGFR